MIPKLSFSWDLYQNSICNGFSSLQQLGEFVDMTLAADGHFVKVHQTLIALSSPYLRALIKTVPSQHPVIFLDNVCHGTLCYLLEYIYTGEVAVPRDKLPLFIRAAKALCLTGIENILEKHKKADYKDFQDAEEELDQDDIDGLTTHIVKMEPLPASPMPQPLEDNEVNLYYENLNQTDDDYFQPHKDTIEIDIESELNIPIHNENTNDFESTVRQIPTPLLTPSGNNLSSLVNLRSPIPQLNVTPNDFNCDSNTSFQMDQFLKGLNLSNDENAQNSRAEFIDEQTEAFDFNVQPISQKSMPMLDIATPGKGYKIATTMNFDTRLSGKGYKGFKRIHDDCTIPYKQISNCGKSLKKMRRQDDDNNSICFSPLLDLIEHEDDNVDFAEQEALLEETDNTHTNIENLMSMPILDDSQESLTVQSSGKIITHAQKPSQIEITNTGELFLKPTIPIKKSSLRNHRQFKRKSEKKDNTSTIPGHIVNESASSSTDIVQNPDELPSIEIHIPETENNMGVIDEFNIEMPRIEIKMPHTLNQPTSVDSLNSDKKQSSIAKSPAVPTPRIKIKIPEGQGSDKVKTTEIVKSVTKNKSKMLHGIQILKVADNLIPRKSKNELSVETTASSGIRSITIQKPRNPENGQVMRCKIPLKKYKRITIKKPPGKQSNKEEIKQPLGFKFKYDLEPLNPKESECEPKDASIIDEIVEGTTDDEISSNVNQPTIKITHKGDDESGSTVNLELPVSAAPSDSMIQYSVTQRGMLQLIMNRYIYSNHHRSGRSFRRWRCCDYRSGKCPAYVDTEGHLIIRRINAHNHVFHDRKILQRVKENKVFGAISEAEENYRNQLKERFKPKNQEDSDED